MRLPSRIPPLKLKLLANLGRRGGGDVIGLDIQPGFVAAVQARVNGSILAERAATVALPPDTMRDGEVVDEDILSEALRELFADSRLGKRVRVGVANQRTVLRTLELPPITDRKELAAAVTFQAQDQVPMPLSNAVMDFHPLGIVDTPAGPRQRVVLVAAQRDMIERLLAAVSRAGLTAEGMDLSAFALIRALYRPEPEQAGRVLYLNVDGLTNLAIAEGTTCRFTRVVGGGLEGMAAELAERRSIPLAEARARLAGVDLTAGAPSEMDVSMPSAPIEEPVGEQEPERAPQPAPEPGPEQAPEGGEEQSPELTAPAEQAPVSQAPDPGAGDVGYEELGGFEEVSESQAPGSGADLWAVIENGIRDISGEVRNSLDFHRSQEGGGEVSHVVMSGAAQDIPGFAEALALSLGVEVRCLELGLAEEGLAASVSPHRLAIATGLAATEASP